MPRAHGVSPKQPYWITLEGFSFLDDCAVSLSVTSPWHIRLGWSLLRLNSDRTRKEAAVKACVTLHGRSSCGCSGTIIECYEVVRGSWFNWATNNTSVSATSLDKKKFQPTHVPHNRACLIPAQWIFHSNSVYWCCSENDSLSPKRYLWHGVTLMLCSFACLRVCIPRNIMALIATARATSEAAAGSAWMTCHHSAIILMNFWRTLCR